MQAIRHSAAHVGRGAGGFALITGMAFVFLMALLAAGVFAFGQQQLHTARHTRDFLKAKVIAEAGANAAYNDIRTNFNRFVNYRGQAVAYGDGRYHVWISTNGIRGVVGNDCARLVSTGVCGIASGLVGMSLRNFGTSTNLNGTNITSRVINNAVAAKGKINGQGTMTITGSASSMTAIDMGGNSKITGKAYAPAGQISGGGKNLPGGSSNDPANYTLDVNTLIDYAAYKNAAVVWDGRADFSTYPAGTIVFCDVGAGNVRIVNAQSGTINCCIISTGGFFLSSHPTIVQTGGYPALISLNGSIDMHGGASVTGIIIAKSPSATSKNTGGGGTAVNITGSFITAGAYDGGGNWDIANGPVSLIYAPGQTVATDGVVVMAFQ